MVLLLVGFHLLHEPFDFILHTIRFLNPLLLNLLLLLSLFSGQSVRILKSFTLRALLSCNWDVSKVAHWGRNIDRLWQRILVLFDKHWLVHLALVLLMLLRSKKLRSFDLADAWTFWKCLKLDVSAKLLFGWYRSWGGVLRIDSLFHSLSDNGFFFSIRNGLDFPCPRLSHLKVTFLFFKLFGGELVINIWVC